MLPINSKPFSLPLEEVEVVDVVDVELEVEVVVVAADVEQALTCGTCDTTSTSTARYHP